MAVARGDVLPETAVFDGDGTIKVIPVVGENDETNVVYTPLLASTETAAANSELLAEIPLGTGATVWMAVSGNVLMFCGAPNDTP